MRIVQCESGGNKIDLVQIFNNFKIDAECPFIQYQPVDGTTRFRYNEKYLVNENREMIMRWFDDTSCGINIRINVRQNPCNEYVTINLNDNGYIECEIENNEINECIQSIIEKINMIL